MDCVCVIAMVPIKFRETEIKHNDVPSFNKQSIVGVSQNFFWYRRYNLYKICQLTLEKFSASSSHLIVPNLPRLRKKKNCSLQRKGTAQSRYRTFSAKIVHIREKMLSEISKYSLSKKNLIVHIFWYTRLLIFLCQDTFTCPFFQCVFKVLV